MGHAGADAAGIILTVDRASFKNFQMAKHAHNLTTGSKRAFSVFLDRAFDSGTALMLPATKTDLNKHQFSYVSACVAEFYFAAAQVTLTFRFAALDLERFCTSCKTLKCATVVLLSSQYCQHLHPLPHHSSVVPQNATDQTTNSTLPVADALQLCQAGPRA